MPVDRQAARRDTSGVVKDVLETDLSAGTSFELDDVDKAIGQTELTRPPSPSSRRGWRAAHAAAGGRRRAHGADRSRAPRRAGGSGLLAGRHLRARRGGRRPLRHDWAEQRGVVGGWASAAATRATRRRDGTPRARSTAQRRPRRRRRRRAPAPTAPAPTPAPRPPARRRVGAPDADARATPPRRVAQARPPGARPEIAENVPPTRRPPRRQRRPQDDDETDEEALLRDAVPNAENAVIGEDEAEAAARAQGRREETGAGAEAEDAAAGEDRAAGCTPAKVETAVLHITSAPGGRDREDQGARPRPHADQPALQDRQHLRDDPGQERLPAGDPQRGRDNAKDRKIAVTLRSEPAAEEALVLPSRTDDGVRRCAVAALACARWRWARGAPVAQAAARRPRPAEPAPRVAATEPDARCARPRWRRSRRARARAAPARPSFAR